MTAAEGSMSCPQQEGIPVTFLPSLTHSCLCLLGPGAQSSTTSPFHQLWAWCPFPQLFPPSSPPWGIPDLQPCSFPPRVLVAMSATFWKASRKATAASTVVLGRRTAGWMVSRGILPTRPQLGHPGQPHLSWECSFVALELKSSQMG